MQHSADMFLCLSRVVQATQGGAGAFEEPLFPAEEMAAIIPADSKKPFDIRKVRAHAAARRLSRDGRL